MARSATASAAMMRITFVRHESVSRFNPSWDIQQMQRVSDRARRHFFLFHIHDQMGLTAAINTDGCSQHVGPFHYFWRDDVLKSADRAHTGMSLVKVFGQNAEANESGSEQRQAQSRMKNAIENWKRWLHILAAYRK